MTLKEELEILRGEPIEVFTGDPMDIPCIETSDPEKLCKHPVVSVHMITYNHEPYIRQAIEGIMMQKTDFEFELVIGEDCSQDKTREICFEYQKKYPDKIRVLWWHENVSQLGGNGRRVSAHCRGEFIALCEGDDYWIDPLKLQKQVDVMKQHPNVGLCFTNAQDFVQATGVFKPWYEHDAVPSGIISGKVFLFLNIFSRSATAILGRESYLRTASVLYRKKYLRTAKSAVDILSWRLRLGDVPLWLSLATVSDIYSISDITTVYRQHRGGACFNLGSILWRDNLLVRFYFARKCFITSYKDLPPNLKEDWSITNDSIAISVGLSRVISYWMHKSLNGLHREAASWRKLSNKTVALYKEYSGQSSLILLTAKRYGRKRKYCFFCEVARAFVPDKIRKWYRMIAKHGEFSK